MILFVGFEGGLNSKATFNITFKKLTGLITAEYRNQQKQSPVLSLEAI